MSNKIILISTITLLIITNLNAYALNDKQEPISEKNDLTLESLYSKIQLTNEALAEVRAGQLNYQIEKGLLKDAFASNIQTLNIILVIILSFGTILGIAGIKSLFETVKKLKAEEEKIETDLNETTRLRIETEAELKEARKLREEIEENVNSTIENGLSEIKKLTKEIEAEFNEMKRLRLDQETKMNSTTERLKLLELLDQASHYFKRLDYKKSMSYVKEGLDINPDDNRFLRLKISIHAEEENFNSAITECKKLKHNDPENILVNAALCELYLLNEDYDDFSNIWTENKHQLIEYFSPYIKYYFQALKSVKKESAGGLSQAIENMKKLENTDGISRRIERWDFKEARNVISKIKNKGIKDRFSMLVDFLNGDSAFDPNNIMGSNSKDYST